MSRYLPHILAIASVLGCEREVVEPTTSTTTAPPFTATQTAEQPPPEPWRVPGTLIGTTASHAIVLHEGIVSVDLETGDVRARANTAAEDPVPSFDRHLPRLGVGDRDAQSVDRLADLPTYVGGEVVVFMRGSEDIVTSLVGLDTTTLEEAWTLEVAYRRPVRSCRATNGVLLIPPAPDPARFVDWLGQQAWLREFGDGELEDFRCADDRVQVRLETRGRRQLRTFDTTTGDLVEEAQTTEQTLTLETRPAEPQGAHQVGEEVVQLTSRN